MSENITPLNKHKRDGKNLLPPFSQLENFAPSSWINERLPEYLWLSLLFTNVDEKKVIDCVRDITEIMIAEQEEGSKDSNFLQSGIAVLQPNTADKILSRITDDKAFKKALQPLLLLRSLPSYDLWESKLVKIDDGERAWKMLESTLNKALFHQTNESTCCRWAFLYPLIKSGRLNMPERMAREIIEFPSYGDLRKVRPSIRAGEIGLFNLAKIPKKWATEFWDFCLINTQCYGIKQSEDTKRDSEPDKQMVNGLNNSFAELFNNYLGLMETTAINSRFETSFGLALYAWKICAEIVLGGTAKFILSRFGLRSMAECYILLKYLFDEDDLKLWETYRAYGSGQIKLIYQKYLEMKETVPAFVDIAKLGRIANEDKWVEFVPINLGNWDKNDLYNLSQKVGAKDIYDKYYSWNSSYVHSQWGAVRNTVYHVCGNPLHRYHRIPFSYNSNLKDSSTDAVYLLDEIVTLLKTNSTHWEKTS